MSTKNDESTKALERAVDIAGGNAGLAKKLNEYYMTHRGEKKNLQGATVYSWRNNRLPVKYVIPIEFVTGVPRHLLNPECYPPEDYHNMNEVKVLKKFIRSLVGEQDFEKIATEFGNHQDIQKSPLLNQ
jgi:hypothetical protein